MTIFWYIIIIIQLLFFATHIIFRMTLLLKHTFTQAMKGNEFILLI